MVLPMKQVLQHPRRQQPQVADVPVPQCGAGEVLVATRASLISAGTEKMLIDFAGKSLAAKAQERPDLAKKVMDKFKRDGAVPTLRSVFAQLEKPLPLGYSAAGEILQVGANLQNTYQVGDRVVMAGAGLANHAEVNAVPKNLVAPLPHDVPFEHGAFCTLGAIALHGVHNANLTLGDRVLVVGLGLVGQLAGQLATLSGARVMGMDFNENRMKLATETGAVQATCSPEGADAVVEAFTQGRGFDAILLCAATESDGPIQQAAAWARDRATVVLVGKVGTTLPYADYMKKELTVRISRSYGPGRYDNQYETSGQTYPVGYIPHTEQDNLATIAHLLGTGQLNVAPLVSHTFDIADAEQAYDLVTNQQNCLGVILQYSGITAEAISYKQTVKQPSLHVVPDAVQVGMLGAGNFATGVMLPALAKLHNVQLVGIASKGGASAQAAAERFKFQFASSQNEDVLNHADVNAVVIMTRHHQHAAQVQAALQAGKHVFVEKPLALTRDELAAVYATWQQQPQVLMVGYNRRFAPQVQALMKRLPDDVPRQVSIRVNAGHIPADNWQNTPEGGGRLLGEVCHFLDLAMFLAGSLPVSLWAQQGSGQDNYIVSMQFANGGMAQVFYTSDGDSSFSKERIEVYAGGCVGVIDNFMTATLTKGGRTQKLGSSNLLQGQDKGHTAELQAFTAAVRGKADWPIAAADLFLSASLPIAAQESIESGQIIKLDG